MKKILVFLAIFLSVALFAGCQDNKAPSGQGGKTNNPDILSHQEGNHETVEYKEHKNKADALLYKEKELDEALKIYKTQMGDLANNNKQRADIRFRIGEIYLKKGKKDEAIEEFKKGLDISVIDEQRIYSLSRIAGIYCSQNKNAKAIEYIEQARKIPTPEGKDVYFGKFELLFSGGTIKADIGDYKGAIKDLRAALEIQPENHQVMSELAFALLRDYQVDEAVKMSDKWMETKKKYDSETEEDKHDEDLVEGKDALHEVKDEECEGEFRYYLIHGDYKKADDVLKGYMKDEYETCLETGYISYFSGELDKSEKLFKIMSKNQAVNPWEREVAKKMIVDINNKRKVMNGTKKQKKS